jgi:hypothetical protein
MKIRPEDFAPEVWEATRDGVRFRILVCAKRFVHSPFSAKADGGRECARLTHPVAILLLTPAVVISPFSDDSHSWKVSTPEAKGISKANARKALAQAWRGVVSITPVDWPSNNYAFKFKAPVTMHTDPDAGAQEKTMQRNVTLCIRWDEWKKRELTMRERADELTAAGMATEEGELTKAGENLALW